MGLLAPKISLPARQRTREEGSLLVAVTVFGLLAMAVWALAFRATLDCIRVERFSVVRTERAETVARALATGVALLRTGEPPSDDYSCIVSLDDVEEEFFCTLLFESSEVAERWEITATVSTVEELTALPNVPESF